MVEDNYKMAIDLLCCHLGITEDEAKDQLGLDSDLERQQQIIETQQALMGIGQDK